MHAMADTQSSFGGCTYPLENLLSSDILQSAVQIFHLLDHILYLALICAFDLARLPNGQVQRQLYPAQGLPSA